MEKWNLPPENPPFWLDLGVELRTNPPPIEPGDFVVMCIEAMPDLEGLDLVKRFEIVANTVVETGWGKHRKGNNLGGWKITKRAAGPGVPWFRAKGNKTSGDPPWCYYRVFGSARDFFTQWLARFVPRNAPDGHRYKLCGEQFWADEPWFDDLIEAGYKGENTKARPDRSIASHRQISEKCAKIYTQHLLGVKTDGDFGPKSEAAAEKLLGVEGVSWGSDLFVAVVHAVKPEMDLGRFSPSRSTSEELHAHALEVALDASLEQDESAPA
jgi:hypothetical protein